MKKLLFIAGVLALLALPAHAANTITSNSCGGGGTCGQGSNINYSTITCVIYDSNSADPPIPCGTTINDYPIPLPYSTIIPGWFKVTWQTYAPSGGSVYLGRVLNTTDATQSDDTGPGGTYNIGTSHTVIVKHTVPASAGGSQNVYGITFYVGGSTNATTTDLKSGYDAGLSTYPGPECANGPPNCYFNVITPNPAAFLPMQLELTIPSVQKAYRGYPTTLALYFNWLNGNATSVAGLGTCDSGHLNMPGHIYTAGTKSASNTGSYYTCKGSPPVWTLNTSNPQIVMHTTLTSGANTYTCHGDAHGGHDPTTFLPTSTCTGTAGDSGITAPAYYAGNDTNTSSTDYRVISYSSALDAYYVDLGNSVSVPLNPQPETTLEIYPTSSAITGTISVTTTGTLYTDATLANVAAGTTPISYTYSITVGDMSSTAFSQPTPTVDPNLPAYFVFKANSAINLCSNPGYMWGMAWWLDNAVTYPWYPISAGTFGEFNTWNYDPSRGFAGFRDLFLWRMDGSGWGNWTASTTYGTAYATMDITPSSDPNGNTWMATVNGGTTGSSVPNWAAHPNAGNTVTDGTQIWLNVGNPSFYAGCIEKSLIPYQRAILLTGGGAGQFASFSGGMERANLQTDDKQNKDNAVVSGLYGQTELDMINSVPVAAGFSPFSDNAGRGQAYELESGAATNWKESCRQGNCANFTSNTASKRQAFWQMNGCINYLDLFINSPEYSTNENQSYTPVVIPMYLGFCAEALIEWDETCQELDSGNSTGLCGDTRLRPILKSFGDFVWMNWWDGTFKGGGPHNYSLPYDPRDAITINIQECCFTELTGTVNPLFDYLYQAYGGSNTLPDGTTYDVAADQMRMHANDGRVCSAWKCTGPGDSYGIPWGAGFTPKEWGQTDKWGALNSYPWRYGYHTKWQTDLTPAFNPCWDSHSTQPCTGSHPFTKTLAPYPFQLPASSEQLDPDAEASYAAPNNYTSKAYSPIPATTITSTTAIVQANYYEQMPSNGAYVKYGLATGPDTGHGPSCLATDGTLTQATEVAGFPQSRSGLNEEVIWHEWPLTGLSPSTTYCLQYCARDFSGNSMCNNITPTTAGLFGGGIHFATSAAVTPIITTATLPGGTTGVAYGPVQLGGTGGFPPYTWSITAGSLPPSFTLTSAGVISGTTAGSGVYTFTVELTDAHGQLAPTVNLSITISSLRITTTTLPGGVEGSPYNCPAGSCLNATGGVPPYTWSVRLPTLLPPGLALNPTTGALTGDPTSCATFTVDWLVTDSTTPLALQFATFIPITVTGCSGSQNYIKALSESFISADAVASGGQQNYFVNVVESFISVDNSSAVLPARNGKYVLAH